jgi:hypothetical protein
MIGKRIMFCPAGIVSFLGTKKPEDHKRIDGTHSVAPDMGENDDEFPRTK